MNPLQLIYPILDALSEGRIIRKIVSIYLKVQAGLLALVGIGMAIMVLKESFGESTPFNFTAAGILVAIIVLVAFFFILQVHLYRADKIDEMEDSTYTIIPIISNNFRLAGEASAILIVALAFCGFLAIAITGSGDLVDDLLPFNLGRGQSSFLGGLGLLLLGCAFAFFTIILAYFIAESAIVLVDMAHNIRRLGTDGPESRSRTSDSHRSYSRPAVVSSEDI